MKIFSDAQGLVFSRDGVLARPAASVCLDDFFRADDPVALGRQLWTSATPTADAPHPLLAPISRQEVWAAGVTYLRSRSARMEESKDTGGATFYDRVYEAERPELFFKATPHRVAAPGTPVRIRTDSNWNVPEPELTLAINTTGRIFGYTLGNDMSSRDIEGENPLYLPQAKVYDRSAALGPCLVLSDTLPAPDTVIALRIHRGEREVFAGETTVGRIKRPLPSLAAWLFRDNTFPHGCYLMTGTGIVPPDGFTLDHGDVIAITMEPVGTLVNPVL